MGERPPKISKEPPRIKQEGEDDAVAKAQRAFKTGILEKTVTPPFGTLLVDFFATNPRTLEGVDDPDKAAVVDSDAFKDEYISYLLTIAVTDSDSDDTREDRAKIRALTIIRTGFNQVLESLITGAEKLGKHVIVEDPELTQTVLAKMLEQHLEASGVTIENLYTELAKNVNERIKLIDEGARATEAEELQPVRDRLATRRDQLLKAFVG